jgi:hypothetical protein
VAGAGPGIAAAAFNAAPPTHEHEFYSDGTSVNTTRGWREMRLSAAVRRQPGTPCSPAQWDQRVLPEPTARVAICSIANCRRVGASWQRLSKRLGLKQARRLSVIADGAKWIWDQAARRLPGHNAQWCVDIYHVSQHLHECGKTIYGEGPPARAWAQQRLESVLQHNGVGLIDRLQRERAAAMDQTHRRRAIDKLLGYLRDNADSLWYCQRLTAGLPIGSGQIEGGCKFIGTRLKLNGARWCLRRAERMGALRCLEYSRLTSTNWEKRAA